MTTLEEKLREADRHCDYSNTADVPADVFDLLREMVVTIDAQAEGIQNFRELVAMRGPSTEPASMSRSDALKAAREHVEAMSTGTRGYQDAKLSDKVQAVDRFARFLMGESE